MSQMRENIGQPVAAVRERKGKVTRGRKSRQRNVDNGEGGSKRGTGRIPKPKRGV
jgi:hypothetical protein